MERKLTVTDVARVLQVSRQHVCNLVDRQEISCYRIPGSRGDRRFKLFDVIALMKRYGVPLSNLNDNVSRAIVAVGVEKAWGRRFISQFDPEVNGWEAVVAPGLFSAGMLVQKRAPEVVVCDLSIGKYESLELAAVLKLSGEPYLLVGIASEDETESHDYSRAGFHWTPRKPISHEWLAKEIMANFGE